MRRDHLAGDGWAAHRIGGIDRVPMALIAIFQQRQRNGLAEVLTPSDGRYVAKLLNTYRHLGIVDENRAATDLRTAIGGLEASAHQ